MPGPTVRSIVATLLAESEHARALSLEQVAQAIGTAAVTMPDIEAIFHALESAGYRVEAEPRDPPATLARVLAAARSFSAVAGRRPTVPEIAQQSGLSAGEVRFALLYARMLIP